MPEIVSIFQTPLWKKIVVSSNDSVGPCFVLFHTEEFSGLQLKELAWISIVKLYAPLQTFSLYFFIFAE